MTVASENRITVEQVPIDDLRPDPANPRRISDSELEALTRSIQEFGLVDPIIARHDDRMVIGGHQRLLAARKLGLKTVPVILVDLSPEKAHLLNLALNKISGTWDQELLARLLADLQPVEDLDLTLSGFSEEELGKLLKSLDVREKRERPEAFDLDAALEAARAAPVAQRGDLWRLGDHHRGSEPVVGPPGCPLRLAAHPSPVGPERLRPGQPHHRLHQGARHTQRLRAGAQRGPGSLAPRGGHRRGRGRTSPRIHPTAVAGAAIHRSRPAGDHRRVRRGGADPAVRRTSMACERLGLRWALTSNRRVA